jgi:hypothetical protein
MFYLNFSKISTAIDWYKDGMDFAGAMHLAHSSGADAFVTFDKKSIKSALKNTIFPVREP